MIFPDVLSRNFRALAHPHRATVFFLLSQHPEAGDSYAILQSACGIPPTALDQHLEAMEQSGVLARETDVETGRL